MKASVLTNQTLRILLTILLLIGLCLASATLAAQSNVLSAKEHLERARSYSGIKDPRAEKEYKLAIAHRGGVYPEAWQELSTYLAHALRFKEAAAAWRKYLKQSKTSVSTSESEHLKRLDRGALLKSRHDDGEPLSLEEMLEVTRLVDRYGSKEIAVPYAEKAVELYPQSGEALVVFAELIQNEQKDKALDLLNRAVTFEPNNQSFYVTRGKYLFWVQGNLSAAEADFRKAIDLSKGTNASAWVGLGDSLARAGRRDEAIAAYRRYLSIRPKSAAHYDGEVRKSIELLENDVSKP